jgi:two-component sensor histidine kinase
VCCRHGASCRCRGHDQLRDGRLRHRPFDDRGRRAVEAQIRGTGVGLSIVRHVVDAHGGEVQVAGRSGGGTVVTMTLPVAAASGADARDAETRPVRAAT